MSKAKEEYYEEIACIQDIADTDILNNYVTELEQQVEDLECCANCKHYELTQESVGRTYMQCEEIKHECNYWEFKKEQESKNYNYYCDNWQFDGLSKKERME